MAQHSDEQRTGNFVLETNNKGEPAYRVSKIEVDYFQDKWLKWLAPEKSAITIIFPPGDDPLRIGQVTLMPGAVLEIAIGPNRDYQWSAKHPVYKARARLCRDKFPYRYMVYCHETRNFAFMDSDPEIIIEGEG